MRAYLKVARSGRHEVPKPDIAIPDVQQPEDMDDEEREMLRILAKGEVQIISSLRELVIHEIATSLRWIQGSLLVVNGGAAVAVLQSDVLPPAIQRTSCLLFVVGICLSLLTANLGVYVTRDSPQKLTQIMGYWMSVTVDLLRSEEIERDWQQYALTLGRRARVPRVAGYASLAAFIAGCLIVGLG